MYIAKYDNAGNPIWAKSAWGYWHDEATSVAVDQSDNVYVAGWFSSPYIIMDADTLFNPSASTWDMFLIKLDSSGNIIWSKSFGGNNHDAIYAMTTDASGDIYITGTFASASVTFGAFTLTNPSSNNSFIVKLDSNGNVLWAKSSVGIGWTKARSICKDFSNNIYVAGDFSAPSITFDSIVLLNTYGPTTGLMFFVKYDSNGNVQWAKSGGNGSGSEANTLTTDSFNNIYVAGTYGDTLIMDSDTLIHFDTSNVFNQNDIFIAKYNSNGNKLWIKRGGGNTFNYVTSIVADNNSRLFLTGYYVSRLYVDSFSLNTQTTYAVFGTDTLLNPDSCFTSHYDIFIAEYNSSGNALWSERIGGCTDDYGQSVSANSNGNVFLAGWFGDTIRIGTTQLTSIGSDLFLAKMYLIMDNIEEHLNERALINLSPNPATSQLIIDNGKLIIENIEIYNVLGEKVYSRQPQTSNLKPQTVDVSQLPSGIYFLKVRGEKEERVVKFVKQ
jgi:hypothetical protein